MTYRVIQWATGGVGRASIEGIVSHPDLELVGCWVHSADKVGKDVGELCGMDRLGVTGDLFKVGEFIRIPPDSLPAASIFFLKSL